jgi:hypothetical protein
MVMMETAGFGQAYGQIAMLRMGGGFFPITRLTQSELQGIYDADL